MTGRYDVVIPTIGRGSLHDLLADLGADDDPGRGQVVVVDDRARAPRGALSLPSSVRVMTGGGKGPAHARNIGWRATDAPWTVFLDDDVRLGSGWSRQLRCDLAVPPEVAGVQARIRVPLPAHRRPTDWERNVAGLQGARWVTADMAYRRAALVQIGGFDPAFPRAFREDADLALRLLVAGWRLVGGRRTIVHPVREADRWVSVRLQRGNRDDALMRARHGRDWRRRAGAPGGGRMALHAATVVAAAGASCLMPLGARRAGRLCALAWAALSAQFAWRRIAPGPRTAAEIATMLETSLLIPPAAAYQRLAGEVGVRMGAARREEGW
ncbi:MAG TPA: glycosyltransferase [Acidimicrobiales bacterium]